MAIVVDVAPGLEPIQVDGSGRVARPWFHNRWATLSFLHWPYDPAVVQALLPPGLTVDTHEGRAWVALVPFSMERVRPHGLPALPWISDFCETNVRTYVHDDRGRRGVYFHSLDAARLAVVLAARTMYGVPYVWSRMRLVDDGRTIAYTSRRRWPGPRGARSDVVVRRTGAGPAAGTDPLLDFLTARWSTLSVDRRGVRWTPVAHGPWTIQTAEVLTCHDELLAAAGYPTPTDPPFALISEGVAARIGQPAR